MDCRSLRDQIESLSLTPLDAATHHELNDHLNECEACRSEFRDYQESWLLLTAALPPSKVSSELEDRVMGRVFNAPQPKREFSSKANFWRYSVAISLLFVLITATLFRLGTHGKNQASEKAEIRRMRAIAEQVAKLDELESVFSAPEVKYVSLQSNPTDPICFLIYDPMAEQIHFLGNNLKRQTGTLDDSSLILWLLTADNQVLGRTPIVLQTKTSNGSALLPTSGINLDDVGAVKITQENQENQGSQEDTPSSPSTRIIFQHNLSLQAN